MSESNATPRTRGLQKNGKLVKLGSAATVPANLSQSGSSSSDDIFFGPMSGSGDGHLVTSGGLNEVTLNSPDLHRVSVAFHIVLHHLCSFYERDPQLKEKLFMELCSRFTNVTPHVFKFKELASLRSHYQQAFIRLIKRTQSHLAAGGVSEAAQLPRSRSIQMLNQIKEEELYHSSRYESEFEELAFIAKGGFGAVFRARNKLDGREYAIKKITLKYCDPELFAKILREVTTLAALSHPNVVSYKTAWLEPFFPPTPDEVARSKSSFPTLSYSDSVSSDLSSDEFSEDEALFSMDQNVPSASTNPTSSSIVFEKDEVEETSSSIVFQEESVEKISGDYLTLSPRRIVKKTATKTSSRKKSVSAVNLKGAHSEMFFHEQHQAQMARNVLSIQELGEMDSFEEENVPTIQGMAATPPNKFFRPLELTPSPNILVDGMNRVPNGDEVDCGGESPGSKFWLGNESSDSDPETCGDENCPENGVKIKQTKEQKRRVTFESPKRSGYWSENLVRTTQNALRATFDQNVFLPAKNNLKVTITNKIQDKAILFLQMQLCDGTLRKWLDDRNAKGSSGDPFDPVDFDANVAVFEQVLRGVSYIHKNNIVHRDLKPRNIFISKTGQIQLGDFGLAKQELKGNVSEPETPIAVHQGNLRVSSRNGSSIHTSGVGTQAYGAPEQLTLGVANEKSDMFSIGIILFELFHPFSTAMERSRAITDLRKGTLHHKFGEKFPRISKIITSLIQPNPNLRPSASALLQSQFSPEALAQEKAQLDIEALKVTVTEKDAVIQELTSEVELLREEIARLKAQSS